MYNKCSFQVVKTGKKRFFSFCIFRSGPHLLKEARTSLRMVSPCTRMEKTTTM